MLPHYSYKTAALASALLFAVAAGFAGAAGAEITGEYSIGNVTADASGADTTEAQARALAQAEKAAFGELARHRNPEKAAEIEAATTPVQIHALIRSFSVTGEKMTADHYHATVHYNFAPKAVQALFAEAPQAAKGFAPPGQAAAGAEKAAEAPRPRKAVLVLPVWNDGAQLKLWQDDNKWRTVWYESALEASGGLVIVPLGDLDDRVDVDSGTVATATAASLQRLYGRYGVGEIYVLSAFYDLKADPKPTLEVTVKRLGPPTVETTHMNYTIHSTETFDQLLARASTDIARFLYKQQTIDPGKIEFERLKDITARIDTTDIKEWQALRTRLLSHGNIVDIRLVSIAYNQTIMTITFKGTPDMLGKTLVASGLRVLRDGDSLVLSLR